MNIRRISFWLFLVGISLFILSPLVILPYASNPSTLPSWVNIALRINAFVLVASFVILWIDAWRRLFSFWDSRRRNENYVLLLFLIFGSPLAAIYFYLKKDHAVILGQRR